MPPHSQPNGKFHHACFISYKHPPKEVEGEHFYTDFARALYDRLEYYLPTPIRTFLDEDSDPGTSYPSDLSRALCRSVCMVAVLTPEYADSAWCLAEWKAMEALEQKRLGPHERGLIIPVALRRSAAEWDFLFKRKPVDFTKVSLPKTQLKDAKNSVKIESIVKVIVKHVEQVTDPCTDCSTYLLQIAKDELASPATFPDPDPFVG